MLGPHCTENPPSLSSTCGAGNIQEIGGLQTYVTGDQNSKLAILLAADAFGYEAPKLRSLADKIAALGFLVVVPDLFHGDPFSFEKPREAWSTAHTPDKGCDDAKNVVEALRSRGVVKVGAAGFCWGGMAVVRLAKYDCIDAAVLLHPGPITQDQINEVKCPIAILGAEIDNYAPPELLKQLGEVLAEKSEVDSYVKIFPGVAHGWSVRYEDDDEFGVKSAEESHVDVMNWFTKHIK
ncbi:endo-1,3;1,4-beta-D-glucanase-like [Salvia hispanica]|uniref:endo-1,3;1,4-beta-D-glucanase-like n=1 Tax=Salvia hispanica TaxID=49212 RepID=UPI002009B862|nr:endo-1,3;1,4-beta-D-glucanase-like [Salvia hispanica]